MVCLRCVSLKKYANQMNLFNPITSGIFGGLTVGLMGATALVAFNIVAPEMTQSQISYRHYSHYDSTTWSVPCGSMTCQTHSSKVEVSCYQKSLQRRSSVGKTDA